MRASSPSQVNARANQAVPDFSSDVGRKKFGFSHEEIDDSSAYYEGQFKLYQRCGEGTLHSPDTGAKYVGQFQSDQFHGKGDQTWSDRSRYIGQWKNGQKNGHGVYISVEGLRYEGQWADGRRHGHGEQEYCNGDRYSGWWFHGLCSGSGTYYFTAEKLFDYSLEEHRERPLTVDMLKSELQMVKQRLLKNVELNEISVKSKDGRTIDVCINNQLNDAKLAAIPAERFPLTVLLAGSRYEGAWANGRYDGPGIYYSGDGQRERQWHSSGLLMKREVLPPGAAPKTHSRRALLSGKVIMGQTRDDMHKPTQLPRPQPSKYLIRRETAGRDLTAAPLRPKTASTQMGRTGESLFTPLTDEDMRPSTARGPLTGDSALMGLEPATPPQMTSAP